MDIDREQLADARDSGLGLGLHTNLTLGKPLTRGRSLVDGKGAFVRDARRAAARAEARDVRAEVEAQVARFEKLVKRPPTHLDTHHHVGLYPPVRDVVLDVARTLGIPVRSQDAEARTRARSFGLRTPDHFFGESGPDAYWSPARTLTMLKLLPPGVSEFMCHPGWFDSDLGVQPLRPPAGDRDGRAGRRRRARWRGGARHPPPALRAAVGGLRDAPAAIAARGRCRRHHHGGRRRHAPG